MGLSGSEVTVKNEENKILAVNSIETLRLEAVVNTLESEPLVSIQELIQVLGRCQRERSVPCARRLFSHLCQWGLDTCDPLGNFLVPMLVEMDCIHEAQKFFDKLDRQNEYSWTCLINAYTKSGQPQHAIELFENVLNDGTVQPTGYTYVAVLKACSELKDVKRGSEIHKVVASTGLLVNDLYVGNAVVDMYAKSGCLAQAQGVFDALPVRDVVTWNVLASGYYQSGQNGEALSCLEQMEVQGISADAISYVSKLKACANSGAIDLGQLAHAEIIMKGLPIKGPLLGSAVVDLYAKCGLLQEAQEVFNALLVKDVIAWTALISGYAEHEQGEEALKCFEQMQALGVNPNAVTFVCSLKACASIGALDKGQKVHAQIDKEGLLKWHVLVGSALVAMYAKCGQLTKAQKVFDKIQVPDIVSWTALIAGYVEQGNNEEAFKRFDQMLKRGIVPDAVVYTCVLKACGGLGAIDRGREMHAFVEKCGLTVKDRLLGNALVDFYAKCGLLLDAQFMFDNLSARNVVTWTALIAGYAQSGHIMMALQTFETMMEEGVKPNLITFVTVINACCHAGLIEKGEEYFKDMTRGYSLVPTVEIYTSMIDLFGRAGHLVKSIGLTEGMPHEVDSTVWHILLGACQKWEDVELGRYTFQHLMQLDPFDHIAFVCMANIYSDAGMHKAAEEIEALRLERQAQKQLREGGEVMMP
ncbi:hypothetical protein GOP47_0006892 [Adiantum capillus-veneris]|uniref:Pentatricopeptide repeat-containing protein n=1 Tax=Adiantum capillus-veneris TaxID=13818 RepID=A0A9D4V4H6_ADICA|nr:hypothetical protein GOP47_0006892 [Adiantum capillus-veneris]